MRKPRDIDSELRALADKAKGLKARKITQLGELVLATGADGLDIELLAGALLSAVAVKDVAETDKWRRQGVDFFRRERAGAASRSRADGDSAGSP